MQPDRDRPPAGGRAAGRRCEYCGLPQWLSPLPFHLDPIVPRKHGGGHGLGNLAWPVGGAASTRVRTWPASTPRARRAGPLRCFTRADNVGTRTSAGAAGGYSAGPRPAVRLLRTLDLNDRLVVERRAAQVANGSYFRNPDEQGGGGR